MAALQGEVAPAPAGSVATGDALEQPSRVPDTPAPFATALPAAAAPAASAAPVSAAEAPKPAGPAGWPRRRRIALLLALPSMLLAAGAVAALGAGGVLGGEDEPRAVAPTRRDRDRHGGTPAQGRGDDPGRATVPTASPPTARTSTSRTRRTERSCRSTRIATRSSASPSRWGRTRTRSPPARARCGWSTRERRALRASRASPAPPTATIPIGNEAQGISLGVQLAWVANTGDDTVQRIDRAQAQTVGDPIGVGDHPIGIFVGSEVWVTNFRDGTLSRIDIATAQVKGEALPTGNGARGVTEGFGAVWVSNLHDNTVTRVNPRTFEVEKQIKVGERPKELVAALGSVWVVNSKSNSVTRIDPRTNRVAGSSIAVGNNPIGITATKGALWVTNFADDTVSAIDPTP